MRPTRSQWPEWDRLLFEAIGYSRDIERSRRPGCTEGKYTAVMAYRGRLDELSISRGETVKALPKLAPIAFVQSSGDGSLCTSK